MLSSDGALTTTLVGILAERELEPTPLEATTFALGIHEDTGSLTYSTTTQRSTRLRGACATEPARISSAATCTCRSRTRRELPQHLLEALEPIDAGGDEVLVAAVPWPAYVEGVSNLAHKIVDLTDARALVLLVEMEGRVFLVARSRTDIDASEIAGALGGGGHAQAASAIVRDGSTASVTASFRSSSGPRRSRNARATSCRAAARSSRRTPSATR